MALIVAAMIWLRSYYGESLVLYILSAGDRARGSLVDDERTAGRRHFRTVADTYPRPRHSAGTQAPLPEELRDALGIRDYDEGEDGAEIDADEDGEGDEEYAGVGLVEE